MDIKRIDRDGCPHISGDYVCYKDVETIIKERDAALQKLAEMKNQKPFAYFVFATTEGES